MGTKKGLLVHAPLLYIAIFFTLRGVCNHIHFCYTLIHNPLHRIWSFAPWSTQHTLRAALAVLLRMNYLSYYVFWTTWIISQSNSCCGESFHSLFFMYSVFSYVKSKTLSELTSSETEFKPTILYVLYGICCTVSFSYSYIMYRVHMLLLGWI